MPRYLLIILMSALALPACEKSREQIEESGETAMDELRLFPKPQVNEPESDSVSLKSSAIPPEENEVVIPQNGKLYATELIAWIRQDRCKRRVILCHHDWDTPPQGNNDCCFPLNGEKERPELNIPVSARLVYSRGIIEPSKGLGVASAYFDNGEGKDISKLPVCP